MAGKIVKIKAIFISTLATVLFTVAFCFQSFTANATEKTFTISVGNKTYELSGKELGYYNGKVFIKCLDGVVDGIFYETAVFPVDATVKFSPNSNGVFSFTREKSGKGIDKEKLIEDINEALCKNIMEVKAPIVELKPSVTIEDLKKFTYKLASFSTYYAVSSENRKHNIKLASEKINGKILMSGEEFSFNKTVGERTEENGFLPATVIENGEFLEGVGGGVCQVSTTIYNCALLSGLKTTERHAHSLVPSYIEPSFDAMVSWKTCDLKFKNVTSGSVYIKAVADGDALTFTFYGEKPTAVYERVSEEHEVVFPPEIEIINDDKMPFGETLTIRQSKNGLKSSAYLFVTERGVKRSIRLHTDTYKAVRGKIKVGTLSVVDKTNNI